MNDTVDTTKENRAVREQGQERRGWVQPQVNIVESRDGYVLEAEMPGVGKDGLEVLLEGSALTIVGRRTAEIPVAQLLYRESTDRGYRRTFELDPAIDTGRITARMDDGILHLELPKSEKVKPRKITVE
jgi:HSP20 family protein